MQIIRKDHGKWKVLVLDARLDVNSAPELEKQGLAEVKGGCVNMVLELSQLVYISSAGLKSILIVGKKAKAAGGKLVICGLTGIVKEVFEMSGFDSFFELYDDLEAIPSV